MKLHVYISRYEVLIKSLSKVPPPRKNHIKKKNKKKKTRTETKQNKKTFYFPVKYSQQFHQDIFVNFVHKNPKTLSYFEKFVFL